MSAGMRIWNADGTLQFGTTRRVMRFLTLLSTGTSNGSASVPALNQGAPVLIFGPSSEGGNRPTVTVVGTDVVWDWGSVPSGSRENNSINVLVF